MRNKIIIVIFSLLMLIGMAGTFWGSSIAEAASEIWGSCDKNKVDCAYPGDCHSYVDTNNDDICDRSQSEPQSTVSSDATSENYADSSVSTSTSITATSDTVSNSTSQSTYYFIPILLVLGGLYGLTWILSTRKIIRNLLHRKIWNVVLLISTLVSALLGLFLILNLDYNLNITLPFNMLFWHVEAGIALGIIAIFHIFWHWRYFAKLIKVSD